MEYQPIFTNIRRALFSGYDDMALESAAEYFDGVETELRKTLGVFRDNADFALVAGVVCFLFYLKIMSPMLPLSYQDKISLVAYILFIVSAACYPVAFYSLPRIVEVSYLLRKEKFLHDLIDHYRLTVRKPVLVDKQVRSSLLFVKLPVSKRAIAAAAMFFLKIVTVDPFKEVVRNV